MATAMPYAVQMWMRISLLIFEQGTDFIEIPIFDGHLNLFHIFLNAIEIRVGEQNLLEHR